MDDAFSIPSDLEALTPAWRQAAVARLNAVNDDPATAQLAGLLGIRFLDLDRDSISAQMPVAGKLQPAGLLHGGAHLVLAETLGSVHAWLLARGADVVGLDINATHLRAVRSGTVRARAEVVHAGGTVISHEVRVRDESGTLLSTARITNLVRRRAAGNREDGA